LTIEKKIKEKKKNDNVSDVGSVMKMCKTLVQSDDVSDVGSE
jgi:hypothetical protein